MVSEIEDSGSRANGIGNPDSASIAGYLEAGPQESFCLVERFHRDIGFDLGCLATFG